jgi:hypothetical protein
VSARAYLQLVCRSRRDGALSRPADSAPPSSGTDATRCRGCPVILRHGWEQLHICVSTTTWPHHCLHAWSSKRERCCCTSTASSPERRARTRGPRTCRSRLALAAYRGFNFIISKWASYFSCRSQICNPLMSLRSHCCKVASLARG